MPPDLRVRALKDADLEAVGLQGGQELAQVGAIAGFDGDVEFGGLGDHAEQPLVLDFDDVADAAAGEAEAM